MRWDYNDDYREQFGKGVHRDILIVPHQTWVDKQAGGPPLVRSKVPVFETYDNGHQVQPKRKNGNIVYGEVPWTITNENIVKEKFEYVNSMNSSDNLTFSSCESAMVKFTIRNTKTYDEDRGMWVPDIPNLFKYELYDEETGKIVVGEVQANSVIKVYQYINGDSSTLIYMGMFVVEEDKPVGEGYEREITAYDFMSTLRDMDIINWYKNLFDGIDVTEDQFKKQVLDKMQNGDKKDTSTSSSTSSSSSSSSSNQNGQTLTEGEEEEDDNAEVNPNDPKWTASLGGRPPQAEWKLGDALKDLFENLASQKPALDSRSKCTQGNADKYKYAMEDDDSEQQEYVDNLIHAEDDEYQSGFGMPIELDPDMFDPTKKYSIPKEPGYNVYECYGYLPILELPIRKNSKLIESGSLSAGKFLEDIGILAGAYPCIRTDKINDLGYLEHDPDDPNKPMHFNTYERCILTFKPLQRNDVTIVADNMLSNDDFVKGFKHDYYKCDMVMALNYFTYNDTEDKPTIHYEYLNSEQKRMKQVDASSIKTFNVTENTFISYLILDDESLKLTEEDKKAYQRILNLLNGKDETTGKTKAKYSILYDGYMKIKYRDYTPYELTTYADPCRDVGDRIEIHFEDKITGERAVFQSYILERKMSGIQKMMDTYTAKGSLENATFSDYKSGTKYSSSSYGIQSFGYGVYGGGSSGSSSGSEGSSSTNKTSNKSSGITAKEFCEIIRNIGFRLLNEPTKCKAEFVQGLDIKFSSGTYVLAQDHNGSWDGVEPEDGSGETHGLKWYDPDGGTGTDPLTSEQRTKFNFANQNITKTDSTFNTPSPDAIASGTYTLVRYPYSASGTSSSTFPVSIAAIGESSIKTTYFRLYNKIKVMITTTPSVSYTVKYLDDSSINWSSSISIQSDTYGQTDYAYLQCGAIASTPLCAFIETNVSGNVVTSLGSTVDDIINTLYENYHFFDLYIDGVNVNEATGGWKDPTAAQPFQYTQVFLPPEGWQLVDPFEIGDFKTCKLIGYDAQSSNQDDVYIPGTNLLEYEYTVGQEIVVFENEYMKFTSKCTAKNGDVLTIMLTMYAGDLTEGNYIWRRSGYTTDYYGYLSIGFAVRYQGNLTNANLVICSKTITPNIYYINEGVLNSLTDYAKMYTALESSGIDIPEKIRDHNYIFTLDGAWIKQDLVRIANGTSDTILPADIVAGSMVSTLKINGEDVEVGYGDYFNYSGGNILYWVYPGVWATDNHGGGIPENTRMTVNPHVELRWKDPKDIKTWEPVPHKWEGTTIVRKEGSKPLHRWDGVRVTYNKKRNKHKKKPYNDTNIELNKTYYYGFFPYYTDHDVDGHPIRYYRFTKTLKVKTKFSINAAEITKLIVNDTSITVKYTIPKLASGTYTDCELYVKKGAIPDSDDDADVVETLNPNLTEVTINDLDANSKYYFVIYTAVNSTETRSKEKSIKTGEGISEGIYHLKSSYLGNILDYHISNGDTINRIAITDSNNENKVYASGSEAFFGKCEHNNEDKSITYIIKYKSVDLYNNYPLKGIELQGLGNDEITSGDKSYLTLTLNAAEHKITMQLENKSKVIYNDTSYRRHTKSEYNNNIFDGNEHEIKVIVYYSYNKLFRYYCIKGYDVYIDNNTTKIMTLILWNNS